MIKYLDIKGCTIIGGDGVSHGVVEDCIFDDRSKKICSAVVIKKSLLSHPFLLRFNNIIHFGDNLMVKGKFHPIGKSIIAKYSNKMFNSYIDRAIIDFNGNSMGDMKDAIIEEETGIVKAIICSRGFVEDMIEGRGVILVDKETIFGQDKIIIKDSNINIYNDMSIWKITRG